ncbi:MULTISPECIES: GTPase HflX [unclassified Nocardioides]|uniref:GTPase HflX n=1 Tax=unclassified Nocardioides TaxID=2615069 RepID=UPI0009EFED5B|nr:MULTISPECIES: GTPase HflX [unclassified Nocardioides]GAW49047.1 HSR1-like GTP-binding protein [Nocardioides sp. PD653-B2]GAW53203.1 HSR1-like GTP-binding protein [Nocardioides sp. PD653]
MTNAPDFNLDAELDETDDWDDSQEPDDGWHDEPDPEDGDEPTVGAMELAERHQLRRVAGLRTELEDITEVEYRQLRLERVVLVGVWTEGTTEDAENSMAELALLAETAGSEVLEAIYQRRQTPDPATYVGRGKVEGIAEIVQATGADTVICDGELAPSQLRNLEDRLKVKVVDRTALILDIFAQHARSGEAQAQTELAQLNYMKQRLRGWGGNLSRQAGGRVAGGAGIGGRGPGETKIETDRRRINTKIAKLRRDLREMKGTRDTKRQERQRHHIPSVSIAGYTNAGKSSLLNRLTDAGVLVEDSLFATLDPTTRRTTTSDGRVYTMSDTVGFVRHLPHQLVEAFRSTLEEVADSDLIVHVVDGSHPDPEGQLAAVREVFAEIGASQVPELVVINKADVADPMVLARLRQREPHSVVVSAKTGEGIAEALKAVEGDLPKPGVEFKALVPYERGDLINRLHQQGEIDSMDHTGEGTIVVGRANEDLAGELAAYAVS